MHWKSKAQVGTRQSPPPFDLHWLTKKETSKATKLESVQEFTENLGLGLVRSRILESILNSTVRQRGKSAPTFKKGKEIGTVDISYQSKTITAQTSLVSLEGKVVSEDDKAVEESFEQH